MLAVFTTAEEPLEWKAEKAHGAGWQETALCALPVFARAVASPSREGLQLLRTAGAAHTGSESGADVHSKFANLNSNTSH
mgnify:CR=1 FL=1|jgi:hypothetical protein